MKKEELIELGIDESVAKQVMAMHGKTITTLNSEVSTLTAERDSLQEQVTTNQTELDTLKESVKGNDELTQQLTDLQSKLDQSKSDSEVKLAAQQKDFAIKLALKDVNALDTDIVLSQLNTEMIQVTDKGLQGLKEQLESLQESKSFLFKQEEDPTIPKVVTPGNPKGAGVKTDEEKLKEALGLTTKEK
ncbi:phage scaffolding protein [Vagococcus fluvialis]|uniref:phage scaffolding protein n=1 Tax=Vagococcus fluvialis TaxID=2738 RepID=UPI0032E46C5B